MHVKYACKTFFVYIVPVIYFIPVLAWASDSSADALALLKKMYSAGQNLNYQGTFVYSHDDDLETMQIFHAMDKSGERERLVHLNGSLREVVREQDIVTCILPDNKSVVVNKAQGRQHFFMTMPANMENLKQFYDFKIAGDGRIAAKQAKRVTIQPKDKFRYGYHLWLDSDTALLLKSDLLDEKGAVIERIMFTNLDVVDAIPEAVLKPSINDKEYTWHNNTQKTQNSENEASESLEWEVGHLPVGFSQTDYKGHYISSDNNRVEHLIVSDGLASVSVYIEKLTKSENKFTGSSIMGAVNVYATAVKDYQVTAVGEVPQATVKMVAESVKIRE
jgi:sigma-E factor negative regulatory protein RseB